MNWVWVGLSNLCIFLCFTGDTSIYFPPFQSRDPNILVIAWNKWYKFLVQVFYTTYKFWTRLVYITTLLKLYILSVVTRLNYSYLVVLKIRMPEDVNPTISSKMVKRLILIIALILITIVIIPIWFFFVSGMHSPFDKSGEYLAQFSALLFFEWEIDVMAHARLKFMN